MQLSNDLLVLVRGEQSKKVLSFGKKYIEGFPRIVEKIIGNYWVIDHHNWEVVAKFLDNFYKFYFSFDLLEIPLSNITYLYDLALKYELTDLASVYREEFNKCKLSSYLYHYMINKKFPLEIIADSYLNLTLGEINSTLVSNFSPVLLRTIIGSPRINRLSMAWNYCWRYISIVNLYTTFEVYNLKPIYLNDLECLLNSIILGDPEIAQKIMLIQNYVLGRISQSEIRDIIFPIYPSPPNETAEKITKKYDYLAKEIPK